MWADGVRRADADPAGPPGRPRRGPVPDVRLSARAHGDVGVDAARPGAADHFDEEVQCQRASAPWAATWRSWTRRPMRTSRAKSPRILDTAPELTDEELEQAELYEGNRFVPRIGRPKGSGKKELVTLRLDRDLLDRFRAGGPGWQTRINDALQATATRAPRRLRGRTSRPAAATTDAVLKTIGAFGGTGVSAEEVRRYLAQEFGMEVSSNRLRMVLRRAGPLERAATKKRSQRPVKVGRTLSRRSPAT